LIQVTEIPNTKKLRIKEISMRPILRTISQISSREQDTNLNNNETVDNEEKDDFDNDKDTEENADGDPIMVTKSYEKFDFLIADNKNLITMPSESPNNRNVDDEAEPSDYEQSGDNQNDEAVYQMKLNETSSNNDYDQDVID
jgi:hypothetical protein